MHFKIPFVINFRNILLAIVWIMNKGGIIFNVHSYRLALATVADSYRVEEQAYKDCLFLLKLADKYSSERFTSIHLVIFKLYLAWILCPNPVHPI